MPLRGRIRRRAKEPRDRWWGDKLFFDFFQTLPRGEQEHIEQALQEYFPSQKSHFASYHSTRKYDRPQPVLNRQLWNISREWTIQHFYPAMGGAKLTSPSMYAWTLRPWTTPGYPLNWRWPTKADALADDEFWDFYEQYRKAHFAWDVLWGSTVKSDELRPPEKIALSELRTFLSSPLHHNVALGEMCADMNDRLARSTSTWCTLGRSAFHRDWHDMLARLPHKNFFGADLSNQDASMFREAMLEQAEIRFEMYDRAHQTDENWERLSNLYIQIVYSLIVLAQGEVVEKDSGNPSGSGNTITDNTMILFRLLSYSWLMLWLEHYETFDRFSFQEEFHYTYYISKVSANLIGDDLLLNEHDDVLAVFHIRGIVRVLWSLFVVMKPEFEEPIQDLCKLSYCSHTSMRYYGTYVPVMEFSRGVASLAWKGASLLHRQGKPQDDPSVHYTLQRVLDIRREGFWNEQLFRLADSLARWILETHRELLAIPARTGPLAGTTLENIMSAYLTPSALIYLYTGKEGLAKQCSFEAVRPTASKLCSRVSSCTLTSLMSRNLSKNTAAALVAAQLVKGKTVKEAVHDTFVEPLEKTADYLTATPVRVINSVAGTHFKPLGQAFHENVLIEDSAMAKSQKKKKKHTKGKGKKKRQSEKQVAKAVAVLAKEPAKVSHKQRARAARTFNRAAGLSRAPAAQLGVRGARPRNIKLNTSAGLTMKGGVISGVTEITPDLVVSPGDDVAGTVLVTLPLSALAIAPGSRFADFAVNYDQFIFEEAQLCLEPDLPYTDSIMLAGGFESDSLDTVPAPGGILDVKKFMEHANFHAESLLKTTKNGARFPRDPRAVVKSGRGPRGGMFYNRLPSSSSTDLNTTQQGWFIIFVHTADQGTLSGSGISLGPLLLRWRVRFREAAERNEYEGQEDFHTVNGVGFVRDPFSWGATNEFLIQPTLTATSTLEFRTGQENSGNYYIGAELPVGVFDIYIFVEMAATGAADFHYEPVTTAQANIALLDYDWTLAPLSHATAVTLAAYLRVQVTGPPVTNTIWGVKCFRLFWSTGNTTGWTYNAIARLRISPVPVNALSLRHPDHRIRGRAWAKMHSEQKSDVKLSQQVALALKRHGVDVEDPMESAERKFLAEIHTLRNQRTKSGKIVIRRDTFDDEGDLDDGWEEKELRKLETPAFKPDRDGLGLTREEGKLRAEVRRLESTVRELEYQVREETKEKDDAPVVVSITTKDAPPAELGMIQQALAAGWKLVKSDSPAAALQHRSA